MGDAALSMQELRDAGFSDSVQGMSIIIMHAIAIKTTERSLLISKDSTIIQVPRECCPVLVRSQQRLATPTWYDIDAERSPDLIGCSRSMSSSAADRSRGINYGVP